jgi:hypothetical protein
MAVCPGQFDIVAHFDSDDISHSERLSEQVALLQSSGADVVGFNEMLFWREPVHAVDFPAQTPGGCDIGVRNVPGEAWLYQNPNPRYALGTSLAYWRHVWERKPFESTSQGEDERFLRGLKVVSTSAMDHMGAVRVGENPPADCFDIRMIARIHAGNTSTAYSPRKMEAEARKPNAMWQRVPAWDAFCAETMR